MQIETLPVERLVPYAKNARTHSDAQVAQLAASIREFGFCNPILIDAQDGIIAGQNLNRRCRAIEISPGYVGVTLQRFLDHTGITPVLSDA